MEKIEKLEWYEAVKDRGKNEAPFKWLFCFGLCNCIISENKQWLLVEDCEMAPHMMYYKIHMDVMHEIYKSLRYLYVMDVKVLAGFYDKSMNVDVFESLSK